MAQSFSPLSLYSKQARRQTRGTICGSQLLARFPSPSTENSNTSRQRDSLQLGETRQGQDVGSKRDQE